jgi:hypothetical protein
VRRSIQLLVFLASPLALAACGAGQVLPVTSNVPIEAPAPAASTPAPSAVSAAPSTTTSMPSTTSTVAPADPAATQSSDAAASSPTDCPHGRWTIDPAELSLVQLLSGDITANGALVVDFADGSYSITADELDLEVLANDVAISISIDGTTTGTYTVGDGEMMLASSTFEMDAAIAIDGEHDSGGFLLDMFRETFGSATLAFECLADGTLSVAYPTPTGPMVARHRPA